MKTVRSVDRSKDKSSEVEGGPDEKPSATERANLYRQRWTVPLSSAVAPITTGRLAAAPIRVLHRFNGGMVYESEGRLHVLAEETLGQHPFLLVFSLQPSKSVKLKTPKFHALPETVAAEVRQTCEKVSEQLKPPENLHNVEVDVTGLLKQGVKLPKGWDIAKGIMKLPITRPIQVACDCDVDGPCGYCCDTCDCNSCYNCC